MDYVLIAYYYSSPFLMAFGAAMAMVVIGGMAWKHPLLPVFVYLAAIFSFPSSRYGVIDGSAASTFYSRGSGVLYFPAVMWMLLVGALWMSFAHHATLRRQAISLPSASIQRWFMLWFVLLLCHVCVGLLLEQPITEILDSSGFVQLPVIGLLVALMLSGAAGSGSVNTLALFVEVAALLKAGFGLVRWAAFGGDPANIYANVEKLSVKLTFFEIGDSLICLMGVAIAVSMLFLRRPEGESVPRRLLHWLVLGLGIACIVLSFRRTAWIGLLLAFAWLLWKLKPAQRWVAIGLAAPILLGALGFVANKRLGAHTDELGLMGFFYDLVSSRQGGDGARVLELKLAAREFVESPIWGNGAWGRYAATKQIAWQDPMRPGNFLHSGVLHIAMKTGLIGLALLVAVLVSFARRTRSLMPADSHAAALIAAACMGLLFMVPDFLGGTPTVQFRTMQLIGVCLALPFFVARAQAARTPA